MSLYCIHLNIGENVFCKSLHPVFYFSQLFWELRFVDNIIFCGESTTAFVHRGLQNQQHMKVPCGSFKQPKTKSNSSNSKTNFSVELCIFQNAEKTGSCRTADYIFLLCLEETHHRILLYNDNKCILVDFSFSNQISFSFFFSINWISLVCQQNMALSSCVLGRTDQHFWLFSDILSTKQLKDLSRKWSDSLMDNKNNH